VHEIYIASSNPGKLRDFAAAATAVGVQVASVPGMDTISSPVEDAPTFAANACLKAEYYSRRAKGKYVLADDSGLEVDALHGAPGVHSARYAAESSAGNASDAANNTKLLAALQGVPDEQRGARFVCAIAVARDGRLLRCFHGVVAGQILHAPRGAGGFGYDPLFYLPETGHTFGELPPARKAEVSHRGQAFRMFLSWFVGL
jgi:XTP/dITP diphosphohydrolase